MKKKIVNIKDIIIPKKMVKPRQYKILGMHQFYLKHSRFDGFIYVNSKNKLLDGYVVYYVAKHLLSKKKIQVKEITIVDRIKRQIKFIFEDLKHMRGEER